MSINRIKLSLLLMTAIMAIFAGPCFAEDTQKSIPSCNLFISFDLKENSLKGTAQITFPESQDFVVFTGNLRILSVGMNGNPVEYKKREGFIEASGKGTLEIKYEGTFRGVQGKVKKLEDGSAVSGDIVSTDGISLTGNWYPSVKGLAYYRLSALVPSGFTAISEAEEITSRETPSGKEYSFSFPHPVDGIHFVAGNYKEIKRSVGGIDIYAYFFPEDLSLADTYLEHTGTYLEMYSALLAPYPYKRFSVVENILPTGYSMPTFTLLGQEVVRLPFIVRTSLGHEITHQWFGNYVFADFQKGNWLEAITTFLSDYRYEEQKGKGWEYRKKILADYQSYVTPEKEFPLRAFSERTGFASMAIGYGKGTMLFHMLRSLVGEETFYRSLRLLIESNHFRNATWEDIKKSFEKEYGKDLGWFFSQWLDRKGVPSIAVKDQRDLVLNGVHSASFRLKQEGEPYKLSLSASILTGKGDTKKTLEFGTQRQYVEITTDETPRTLIIDEGYDIMRRLRENEFPPVISRLLGDEKRLIVYSESEKGIYGSLIEAFRDNGFMLKETKDLKDEDIRTSSLLILGYESPVIGRLFAGSKRPGRGFSLTVRDNPLNNGKVIAYANADSPEEVIPVVKKIFHYGKYTSVRFEKGENVEKDIAKANRGMIFAIGKPIVGVVPKKLPALEQIIDNVAEKPLIFIGERHANYEDHKVELSVIMELYKKGKKFAIGMEMFQKPFQEAIDNYISGKTDEKEFLKKSEYFKRWGLDYNLYREIIEFARNKGIPIVALNLKSEVVHKVASGGLDSLSLEEKKDIPQDMDMSDYAYRERLKNVFESHPAGTKFDNFYQSQILWDETMAHSAAAFLREKPDYQLVVLAGVEHIMYGSGIPARLHRLTGREYATLINGAFDEDIGNYVIFADSIKPPFSAKLGAILRGKDGRVIIEDFSPDSPALKAGMKKGDAVILVDGWKIQTVEDVRIALCDKKPYESVQIQVMRKRFLASEKEIEFHVLL